MIRTTCSIGITLLFVSSLFAGSIELWDGTKAGDVTIGDVKDGYLHYQSKSGSRRIQLSKLKHVTRSDSGSARIVRFIDYTDKSRTGKLLTIAVASDEVRIKRPFVRVLFCVKNKRAELELYSYQNARINDPTNYGELDEVQSTDFKTRHYQISRSDGMAFRIEVWQEGRMTASALHGNKDRVLPVEWYKKMPVKSTRTLKVSADIDTEKEVEETVTDEVSFERGWKVASVSVLPEPPGNQPRVKVSYQLYNPDENSATSPKILIYYVQKSSDGDLEVTSMTVSSGGKTLQGTKGIFRGAQEKKIPGTIRLTALEAKNTSGATQLVHWRVELLREDRVLAFKEKAGAIGKKMPKGWWK